MKEHSHAVFAVRDRALNAYMQPFFVASAGVAVRSFSDEVNRTESPMNGHPEDYDLYHLGFYSEDTGRMEPLDAPRMVAVGKDVIRQRE